MSSPFDDEKQDPLNKATSKGGKQEQREREPKFTVSIEGLA
jgi:hypothetical protein